ncbi:mycothiol system anti-sigma-R factor [Isoptericola croceus]|uniref:mycothiol system anti-sigma-R factor n=1 Tax=Isoptericola croceus TaxID=3031406 RepID=UPI0023F7B4E9|nr:mycothiol system anti-sigma-R factor [Isoptericola croceus]
MNADITPVPHEPAEGESDCQHVLTHLYEYLDSEMTAADEHRMRAHVAHCSPCLVELSVEEIVKKLVKRSCAEQAPETLRLRIREQITILAR